MDHAPSTPVPAPRLQRHRGAAPLTVAMVLVLPLVACESGDAGTSAREVPAESDPATAPPGTSPSTTAASAAIDTSEWLAFESEHYGFGIAYPPDWEAHQGRGDWTFPDDTVWPDGVEVSDWFYLDDPELGSVAASVWSVGLAPGTSADQWFADYCAVEVTPCDGTEPWEAATLDGHAGRLVRASDPMAYFGVGDRVYVLAVWQPADHPALARYGGGDRLLEAFVSAVRLQPPDEPESPSPDGDVIDAWLHTSTWVPYSSERYGFTITHPPTWTVIESSHDWDQSVDSINWDNGGTEVFAAPDGSIYLAVWAVEVDPATTLATWAQAFCDQYVASCTDVEEMSEPTSANAGERDAVLLAWDDGIVTFIPSWYDEADPKSIWEQPAPAGARIHLVESGRPDGGPHRAREFVDEFTRSLCVGCAG